MTAPTPPTEEPRGRDDILTLAQHCKTYADGDVYLAATRVLHLFRTADPFAIVAAQRTEIVYRKAIEADLHAAYERVVADRDRLHTWQGLMSLIEEHYPTDIFPVLPDAEDRDDGPRILSLLRHLDRLRSDLNQATLSTDHTYLSTACLHAAEPGREALHRECQVDTRRYDGSHKQGATCKFCPAQCVCTCHSAVCADVDEAGETDA